MKKRTGMQTRIPVFGGDKTESSSGDVSTLEVRKSFLLDTIRDVEAGVFARRLDIHKSEKMLDAVRKEHSDVVPKRDEILKKYREMDGNLGFLLEKIKEVKARRYELKQRLETALEKKRGQSLRAHVLVNEAERDRELRVLRETVTHLSEEYSSSGSLLNGMESDYLSLSTQKRQQEEARKKNEQEIHRQKEAMLLLNEKKADAEQTLRLSGEIKERLKDAKHRRRELVASETALETENMSLKEMVEDLKMRQKSLADQLEHYEQEERVLNNENREALERSKKTRDLKESLQAAISENEKKRAVFADLEQQFKSVGSDEDDLVSRLRDIKKETESLVSKKRETEKRAGSLIETLNAFSGRKESVEKEKELLTKMIAEREALKDEIHTRELEVHYYKEALEEILVNV